MKEKKNALYRIRTREKINSVKCDIYLRELMTMVTGRRRSRRHQPRPDHTGK